MNTIDIIYIVINIMLMNLKQMEVFRAVMSTGSVSSAAQLLHVTPPGVSRMMKHLQLQLGVPLFERLGNRLVPTADARKLYREIDRVYQGIEQVNQIAETLKTGHGGQLNVICSPSVALRVGPQAVAHMLRTYPGLVMRFETRPLYDIYQQLTSQQSDLAISLVPIEHPGLQQRLLTRVGLVVVLPIGHPLTALSTLKVKDLAKIDVIKFPVETTQGATLAQLLQEHGVSVQSSVTVRIARDACALVAQGVGAAVIDALTANNLTDPALTTRPLQASGASYGISALWSKDYPLTHLGKAFVEHVRLGVRAIRTSQ
jgi:DNA-binding transcriptional LysR family regulator